MLKYVLLTFLLGTAVASWRLGQPFRNLSLRALITRTSLFPAENRITAPASQAAAESPLTDTPQKTSDQDTKEQAANEVQQASSASREETKDVSSSPEALRAPRPTLPANVQSRITTDNAVTVRVRINRSGKVIHATAVSVSGPQASSLTRYAVATAYRWRFHPARQNGKSVQAERVVEFLFRPSDDLVSRVQSN